MSVTCSVLSFRQRCHALEARIDAVLLAADDDEKKPGLGERIGAPAGALGGAVAGMSLPSIAARTAAKPVATGSSGLAQAFGKLRGVSAVRNSPMATGAVNSVERGGAAVARGAGKLSGMANSALAGGGGRTRFIGGAVLGLGGYAAGKAVGRLWDNLGYTQQP